MPRHAQTAAKPTSAERRQYKRDHQNNMRKVAYTLRALFISHDGTYGCSFSCKQHTVQATDKFDVSELQVLGAENWAACYGFQCDFRRAIVFNNTLGVAYQCHDKRNLTPVPWPQQPQQQQQQQVPQPVQQQAPAAIVQFQQAPQPVQQQPAPQATVQPQQAFDPSMPANLPPPGEMYLSGRDSMDAYFIPEDWMDWQFPNASPITWSTTWGGHEDRFEDFRVAIDALALCLADPPDHSEVRINGAWYLAGQVRSALAYEVSASDVLPVRIDSDSGANAPGSSGSQWEGLELPAVGQLVPVQPASPQMPEFGDDFLKDLDKFFQDQAATVASGVDADTMLGTQVGYSSEDGSGASVEKPFDLDDLLYHEAYASTDF